MKKGGKRRKPDDRDPSKPKDEPEDSDEQVFSSGTDTDPLKPYKGRRRRPNDDSDSSVPP